MHKRSNKELDHDAWEILHTFRSHDDIFKRFPRTKFRPHWVGAKTGFNLTLKRIKKAIREAENTQKMGRRLSTSEFEALEGYKIETPSISFLKDRALEKYEQGKRDHIQNIDKMVELIKTDPDIFPPAIKVGNIQTGGRTRDALCRLVWGHGYKFIDVDLSKYGEGSKSATRRVRWMGGSPSAGSIREAELSVVGKKLRGSTLL